MQHILVVEDEPELNGLVTEQLRRDGYLVTQAFDGPAALAAFRGQGADLVVLDWMLPGLDGLSVLREIRKASLVPVLMLTARGQDIDVVNGLEAGADDYLAKPAHIRVLRARVAALLRRANTAPATSTQEPAGAAAERIAHGPFVVDREGREVAFAGLPLDLTPTEFDLIELFCLHPGRAFSREYLLERIWKEAPDSGSRTVDTHIQRLRKKLGDGDATIQTVWGLGYRVKAS